MVGLAALDPPYALVGLRGPKVDFTGRCVNNPDHARWSGRMELVTTGPGMYEDCRRQDERRKHKAHADELGILHDKDSAD
jgi:hypothetical protein